MVLSSLTTVAGGDTAGLATVLCEGAGMFFKLTASPSRVNVTEITTDGSPPQDIPKTLSDHVKSPPPQGLAPPPR